MYRSQCVFHTVCGVLGLFFAWTIHVHAASSECHVYDHTNTPRTTLGAPYDIFDTANRTLVRATCDSSQISANVGATGRAHLIYTTGYAEFTPGVFTPFSLTATAPIANLNSSDWVLADSASGNVAIPASAYGATINMYTYTCQVRVGPEGKSLKCGCNEDSRHACTQKHSTHLGTWVLQKVKLPEALQTHDTHTGGFRILIGTNQIKPHEAAGAHRFAADGVWSIPQNSPAGIDWTQLLKTLNADKWNVSEDNPDATIAVNFVSAHAHRMVDAAVFYIEDGMATPIRDFEIDRYAAHTVPGYGKIGNRVTVLTRSFEGIRREQLIHALKHPMVSGATFEFNPSTFRAEWAIPEGCAYVLSLGKQCYLLMPPSGNDTDFVSSFQRAVSMFEPSGVLKNSNTFIVPSVYVLPKNQHFLSTSPSDRNSIEAVVAWLKEYRSGL